MLAWTRAKGGSGNTHYITLGRLHLSFQAAFLAYQGLLQKHLTLTGRSATLNLWNCDDLEAHDYTASCRLLERFSRVT